MPKIRTKQDQPWTSNYPELDAWLKARSGSCVWQVRVGGTDARPNGYIECWRFPGTARNALIMVWADHRGWDIATPGPSNKIADTLADADARLGIGVPA